MRASGSGRRRQTLPAELTSFIGRRRELADVKRLLAGSRLLTLTGPGGVGKTRLALRAASELARAFHEGAWLVELAALEDPSLVASAVARALGLREESARWLPAVLSDYLAERRLLLVLDNCEHLLSATAVLADTLLRAAPSLAILATSREALGITGEANFVVPSMSVPQTSDAPKLERLVQYEAVSLFDERARAIDPKFRITVNNRQHVIELCRRLDGIPLAIELAAVRLRALTLAELVGRLGDEFRVLTQGSRTALPRQQTLHATIEWSWNLLSESEQVLWRRLSVFAGGFDLDAVGAVAADDVLPPESIFDSLAGLVDKSIVSRSETDSRTRYWMLETLRQFAREKAADAGEMESLATRHLAWCSRLCESAAPDLQGPRRHEWLDRLDADLGNLQVAFDRAQLNEQDAETGLVMMTRTLPLWQTRGHQLDGLHWLRGLLARTTSPTPERLRDLAALAWLALSLGATDEARSAIADGIALADRLKDADGLAGILATRGLLAIVDADFETAITYLRRSEELYRGLGRKAGLGEALQLLGVALFYVEDLTNAEPAAREAIDLANEIGNADVRGHAELALGWILVSEQRHTDAEAVFRQALAARSDLDRWTLGMIFDGLAYIAAQGRRPERAATLMGVVDKIWIRGRPALPHTLRQILAECERKVLTELGNERFERARERGQSMEIEQAVEFASQYRGSIGPAPSARRGRADEAAALHSGLSRRELEVAALVAKGMSNKEIAAKLILSERTIDHHVAHILDKLGFNSRAQVAVWAAESAIPS